GARSASPESIITEREGFENCSLKPRRRRYGFRARPAGPPRNDASLPLHLHHFVGPGAARRDDFDLRALLLADQRAGERRGNGNSALLGVSLRLADNLPDRLLVGVLVDQRHGRAERDGIAGQFRHVDDLGAGELVLKLRDMALVERLRLFGGVILGVLREVAVRARISDLLNNPRPLHLLALLELRLKCRIAGRGHRNLIHRPQTSKPAESRFASRSGTCPATRLHACLYLTAARPARLSAGSGR